LNPTFISAQAPLDQVILVDLHGPRSVRIFQLCGTARIWRDINVSINDVSVDLPAIIVFCWPDRQWVREKIAAIKETFSSEPSLVARPVLNPEMDVAPSL
jgi:hypothetical protein